MVLLSLHFSKLSWVCILGAIVVGQRVLGFVFVKFVFACGSVVGVASVRVHSSPLRGTGSGIVDFTTRVVRGTAMGFRATLVKMCRIPRGIRPSALVVGQGVLGFVFVNFVFACGGVGCVAPVRDHLSPLRGTGAGTAVVITRVVRGTAKGFRATLVNRCRIPKGIGRTRLRGTGAGASLLKGSVECVETGELAFEAGFVAVDLGGEAATRDEIDLGAIVQPPFTWSRTVSELDFVFRFRGDGSHSTFDEGGFEDGGAP